MTERSGGNLSFYLCMLKCPYHRVTTPLYSLAFNKWMHL